MSKLNEAISALDDVILDADLNSLDAIRLDKARKLLNEIRHKITTEDVRAIEVTIAEWPYTCDCYTKTLKGLPVACLDERFCAQEVSVKQLTTLLPRLKELV